MQLETYDISFLEYMMMVTVEVKPFKHAL